MFCKCGKNSSWQQGSHLADRLIVPQLTPNKTTFKWLGIHFQGSNEEFSQRPVVTIHCLASFDYFLQNFLILHRFLALFLWEAESAFSSFKTSVFGVFPFWQDYRIFMIYFFSYYEHRNKQKTGLGVVVGGTSKFLCGLHFCVCVIFENSPIIFRRAGFNSNYKSF